MKLLKVFGQFWFDFIIGDDWKIAAAVVSALALAVVGLRLNIVSEQVLTVVGAVLVMTAFSISLVIDVRKR